MILQSRQYGVRSVRFEATVANHASHKLPSLPVAVGDTKNEGRARGKQADHFLQHDRNVYCGRIDDAEGQIAVKTGVGERQALCHIGMKCMLWERLHGPR